MSNIANRCHEHSVGNSAAASRLTPPDRHHALRTNSWSLLGRQALAWVALVFAYSSPARAEETPPLPRYSLGWTVSDSTSNCAGTHALATAAEAILGSRVFVPVTEAVLFVEGRTERTPAGAYDVKLEIFDRNGVRRGSRRFSKAVTSCRELDQPLALMIALAIDPRSNGGPSSHTGVAAVGSPRSLAQAAEPMVAIPQKQVSLAPVVSETARARRGSAEMDLRLGFGIAPRPVLGLATGVLLPLAHEPWVARFGASVWMPARAPEDQTGDGAAGAWFNAAALQVAGCYEQSLSRLLEVMGCTGLQPGVALVQGYGYHRDRSALRPSVDASFGLAATVRLGVMRIKLEVDMLVPFVRDEFYASNLVKTEIFRRPALGSIVALGLFFDPVP
jgi:hypothetical protein